MTNALRIFQFWGTQNWTGANQFTPRYSGSGDFESFSIPVGQFYIGSSMRLVFVNDKDAGTPTNLGRFGCVRVVGAQPPPPPPTGSFEAHFDNDAEGFTYVDDPFRGTSQPVYASGAYLATGGFAGGGLSVDLGGIDDADINNMSGGWRRAFSLAADQQVALSLRYNLTQAANYESNELSQALLSVDGNLIGFGGNDYLAQIAGDGGAAQSTGWVLEQFDLGVLSAGSHTLTLGGFNNLKTFNDESTQVLIDDVILTAAAPNVPPTVTITAPADGSQFVEGTNVAFSGNAGDAEDGDVTADLEWTSSRGRDDRQRRFFLASPLDRLSHHHRIDYRQRRGDRIIVNRRRRHGQHCSHGDDQRSAERLELHRRHERDVHRKCRRRRGRRCHRRLELDL